MPRALAMLYAFAAYGAFFITFLWFIAFVGDIRAVGSLVEVPTTVDAAQLSGPAMTSAIVDIGLIALFGGHHSVAARSGFKEKLTQTVPKSVERSTYVLIATVLLAALMWFWHPIDGALWDVRDSGVSALIWGVFAIGWAVLFLSTFLLNHFELFGLQQAWHHGTPSGPPAMEMRTPLFYKVVRHPLYLGFVIALWATPHMTYGHLLLSAGLTVYILIGIHYEEQDLVAHFGAKYEDYRTRVGSLIPGIGKSTG